MSRNFWFANGSGKKGREKTFHTVTVKRRGCRCWPAFQKHAPKVFNGRSAYIRATLFFFPLPRQHWPDWQPETTDQKLAGWQARAGHSSDQTVLIVKVTIGGRGGIFPQQPSNIFAEMSPIVRPPHFSGRVTQISTGQPTGADPPLHFFLVFYIHTVTNVLRPLCATIKQHIVHLPA